MIQKIKVKSADYRKIWVLTDLHLNQSSGVILNGRGKGSKEEHDRWIRDFWFENITNDDLVIDLGDSHFNDPESQKFFCFSTWPAKKHLYLWGNHTSGSRQSYLTSTMGQEIYPHVLNNVTFVGNYLEMLIDNKPVVLSHFPLSIFNYSKDGGIHLCGHCHGTYSDINPTANRGKILDCGVENAIKYSGKPFFEWSEILDIMKKKDILKKDGHH